jgi:membrane protein YdbS with pleckstrin-like domain
MTDPDTDAPPPQGAPAEPPAPAAEPPAQGIDTEWNALPPAARQVLMGSGFVLGLPVGLMLWLVLALPNLDTWLARGVSFVVMPILFAAWGAWIGRRRWLHTRWRLDARGLQVRRGRMWQREVLVPRSRVQHLDLERGPIERHYGLATIVVHTAGTRLQALRQSGLAEADAVALRDALVPEADRDGDAD